MNQHLHLSISPNFYISSPYFPNPQRVFRNKTIISVSKFPVLNFIPFFIYGVVERLWSELRCNSWHHVQLWHFNPDGSGNCFPSPLSVIWTYFPISSWNAVLSGDPLLSKPPTHSYIPSKQNLLKSIKIFQ